MQLSVKRDRQSSGLAAHRKLADLREGEAGVIERIELPDDLATRLMELGFLPGSSVTAARCAPGGDPRVFRVDGSEIALRKDTASHLILKM
jgi:ferrous iron transport protein A